MTDMISNTQVSSAVAKDNSRLHVGNKIYVHLTENRCLSDLKTTDPRLDKVRIEATKGGLFEDSYRWILEHNDFQKWRDDEEGRLLWIKGDPGKGKTMLLCGIVNELAPRTRLKNKEANILLSYFFCQAADERINSATAVLRGLIYLIVKQQPALISHVQEKYENGVFKDVNAWFALSEIFLNILEDENLERTYVIIDALDECVTGLPELLDFINKKSVLFSRVKWIVSSRNWPDIEESFDSATQQLKLCLELNEKSISAAVNAYIEHQVKQLVQKKKYDAKTKDAVQHHLFSNSNDTFLWVALVCQNLEKTSLQNISSKLDELPSGLDALYKRMMEQIHHLEDVRDTKLCCQIIATVLLVYRPITLAELGSLIESSNHHFTDAESIQKAVGLCGSFLTVRDNQVYVIHQSVKDYLSRNAVSTAFLPSPADVHVDIFLRSIQVMSTRLRRNIYNSCSPGLSSNEIKTPDPDPLSAIRYSCIHWVDHFCDIHNSQPQNQAEDNCRTVLMFLQKYFLYWLEALGLMGYIEDGVLSMARLEDLLRGKSSDHNDQELTHDSSFHSANLALENLSLEKSSNSQLFELAQDSRRFIRQNSSLIADSPLQVYTSALIFSPLNSLIRKIFENEEPQWLKVKPIVEPNWGPYLQTLKGHSSSVQSVTFSPDGRYLASGSNDKTIKIWDVITGKELQTLKGHSSWVRSVTFSPDGRYLASGSSDKTINIWDTVTGEKQQTIHGHKYIVRSVAFSVDSCYIASGSGSIIKLWDIITGEERQTFQGYGYIVFSVAFSANSCYLASGSNDNTIRIWDIITGKERQILQGHKGSVWSVAFSADSGYLASGSSDKTIRIWDTATGKEQQILQGHNNSVCSVAFSADGRCITSGSSDKAIKIWDIITGKEQQTLMDHSKAVRSVAFSADGRYLASGSEDDTIKIWDITGKEQQTVKSYSRWVRSATFSPDGRYFASGLSDNTIKIWDTKGKEQHTLKGHKASVRSVAFSANGRYLASGSDDNTIKIWNITGKILQTLKGHSNWVRSVTFSPDGRYLASGSYDKTIKIWDITGKEQQTLKGHSSWVQLVTFSADGRYLVSRSDDKTIKIWDTTTGKEQQTLEVNATVYAIYFDDTVVYLDTNIGPIKFGVRYQTEAQSMMTVQVLLPDSDPVQDQDQRQRIVNNTQKANSFDYGLSTDKCWITWNEHNILWLPPEYRPSVMAKWPDTPHSMSPRGSSTDVVVALIHSSERVAIMKMSGSGPHPLV